METKLLGRVRKMLEGVDAGSPGDDEQIALSLQLETLIAQGRAPYGEIVRMGRAFYVVSTAAVASIVPATALTTASALALYNGEPDGGRSYVIDWISSTCIVTTTTVAAQAITMGLVGQVREAIPADAGLVMKKCNGLGNATDTRARGVTAALPANTGIRSNWFPISTNGAKVGLTATTAAVGYGTFTQLDGRFIIAPGRYFALQNISQAASETFVHGIGWHEVKLELG